MHKTDWTENRLSVVQRRITSRHIDLVFLCWLQSIVHSRMFTSARAHTRTYAHRHNGQMKNIKRKKTVERREIKRERVYKTIVKDVVFAFHVYASQWNLFMWFFFFIPSIHASYVALLMMPCHAKDSQSIRIFDELRRKRNYWSSCDEWLKAFTITWSQIFGYFYRRSRHLIAHEYWVAFFSTSELRQEKKCRFRRVRGRKRINWSQPTNNHPTFLLSNGLKYCTHSRHSSWQKKFFFCYF